MPKNGGVSIDQYRWGSDEEREIVLTNLSKTGPKKIAEMRDKLFPKDPQNAKDRLHARTDALVSHLQTVTERAIEEAMNCTNRERQAMFLEIGAGEGEITRGLMEKLSPGMRNAMKIIALDPYHKTRQENGIFYIRGSVTDYAKSIGSMGPAEIVLNTADPHHAGTAEQIIAHIQALTTFVKPGGRLVLTDTVHSGSWRRDIETTIACHNDTDVLGQDLPRAKTYLTADRIRQALLEAAMEIEEESPRSPSMGAREYHYTFLARKPLS